MVYVCGLSYHGKISIVTNASGIIHKARVSFIKVAMRNASPAHRRLRHRPPTKYRMNGYCSPGAKLLLAHLKEMSYRWENYKQCYSIQNEYNAQRYRHLLLIGVQHRTHCGNCASSAKIAVPDEIRYAVLRLICIQ